MDCKNGHVDMFVRQTEDFKIFQCEKCHKVRKIELPKPVTFEEMYCARKGLPL